MLAFAITLLFALYILGPDACSRFILDFSVPRRAVTLTKSEEVCRAVIWGGASFLIALLWMHASGTFGRLWNWQQIEFFYSGLCSEQFFRENRGQWFHSLHDVLWMNICILWRLYVIVAFIAFAICVIVRFYGRLRHRISGDRLWERIFRRVMAVLILPRIASWHVLLSYILLPNRKLKIRVDVLMKSGILYQGRFADKMLAADGSLMSITLSNPRRFRRDEYKNDKMAGNLVEANDYWRDIPTNVFVLMASDIQSINIRYLEDVETLKRDSENFRAALETIRIAISDIEQHAGGAGLGNSKLSKGKYLAPDMYRSLTLSRADEVH